MKKRFSRLPSLGMLALVLVAPLLVRASSCSFFPEGAGVQLGVPYRAQDQLNYCAAAAVLMWRLYDGRSEISQQSIFNWMGGVGCTTPPVVTSAVRNFTFTTDAFWDKGGGANANEMAARQIASVNYGTPVLAVVDYNHTGIINGGKWHAEANANVWDFVYFHDPDPRFGGANLQYSATNWFSRFCSAGQSFCDQIISASASAKWAEYLSDYGSTVRLAGGGRDSGRPQV